MVATAFQLEYYSSFDFIPAQLEDAYEQWVGSAAYPRLINELLLLRADTSESSRFAV
jgi:hypothetical protein